LHRYTIGHQDLGAAAGREYFHAEILQSPGKFHDAPFVGNADERPRYLTHKFHDL
jgi:hypothetical protein